MNLGTEGETIEFKESISQLDKGVLSLTAMLNRRNHGALYIGVDDKGDVIGRTSDQAPRRPLGTASAAPCSHRSSQTSKRTRQ